MSKKLTTTILSISLLTVMAGAAVAPALGTIQQHFSDAPTTLVRLIVSIPALFIIVVNLLFPWVTKMLRTRTIALLGLIGYVVFGMGAFLAVNIAMLLLLRGLLGVCVGLLMPLSTGLLAYYNPPEKMPSLMGLSAAMNQMGGVLATLLAGVLATIGWNYAFLVYGLGLIAVVLVVIHLPNERLDRTSTKGGLTLKQTREYGSLIVSMVLCMVLFFVFVSNFSIAESGKFTTLQITYLMMGVDVIALIVGLFFGPMMKRCGRMVRLFPPVAYMVAFSLLSSPWGLCAVVAALALIGLANGVGIPYLNTMASTKGGKDSVSVAMPLMSAALYIGQFASPLVVGLISTSLPMAAVSPYQIAAFFSVLYLLQVVLSKK